MQQLLTAVEVKQVERTLGLPTSPAMRFMRSCWCLVGMQDLSGTAAAGCVLQILQGREAQLPTLPDVFEVMRKVREGNEKRLFLCNSYFVVLAMRQSNKMCSL